MSEKIKIYLICFVGCSAWLSFDAQAQLDNGPFLNSPNVWTSENTFSPANQNVTISPTGTGTLIVNPETRGNIDNIFIGANTPTSGGFTNIGLGGTVSGNYRIQTSGTTAGGSTQHGGFNIAHSPADYATSFIGIYSRPSLLSGTVMTSLTHYLIQPAASYLGTVTNQYGVSVNNLTGATNNYAFYSNMSASANRWVFYSAGGASSYSEGNFLIGSATDSGEKLQVTGESKFTAVAKVNAGIQFPATASLSANANTLDDYRESSYTATATGLTTAPTATIVFTRIGNQITMTLDAISGTSNATTFTLTGGPTTMRPTAARIVPVRVRNNSGNFAWGMASIATDGIISFFIDANGTGFTASGSKGVAASSFSYSL